MTYKITQQSPNRVKVCYGNNGMMLDSQNGTMMYLKRPYHMPQPIPSALVLHGSENIPYSTELKFLDVDLD